MVVVTIFEFEFSLHVQTTNQVNIFMNVVNELYFFLLCEWGSLCRVIYYILNPPHLVERNEFARYILSRATTT